jgi:ferredoxin
MAGVSPAIIQGKTGGTPVPPDDRRNIVRIIIKKEACIGCEICVNTCPEVFMEWGLYMRPVFEVKEPERCKALIEKAVEDCPARAISVDMGELQTGGAKG